MARPRTARTGGVKKEVLPKVEPQSTPLAQLPQLSPVEERSPQSANAPETPIQAVQRPPPAQRNSQVTSSVARQVAPAAQVPAETHADTAVARPLVPAVGQPAARPVAPTRPSFQQRSASAPCEAKRKAEGPFQYKADGRDNFGFPDLEEVPNLPRLRPRATLTDFTCVSRMPYNASSKDLVKCEQFFASTVLPLYNWYNEESEHCGHRKRFYTEITYSDDYTSEAFIRGVYLDPTGRYMPRKATKIQLLEQRERLKEWGLDVKELDAERQRFADSLKSTKKGRSRDSSARGRHSNSQETSEEKVTEGPAAA
ncbi:unnamed protein product [Parajaminaea phylloscopi]